jgi:hypothetical protein
MSISYNNDAPRLGDAATTSNLTALFDNRADADSAVKRLKAAGIDEVRLLPGYEASEGAATTLDQSGFWAKLEDWFFPDDDRATYAEGLKRGGFLVSVDVDRKRYDTAHDILDDDGTIDIDDRADLWRREGWDTDKAISEFRQVQTDPVSTVADADRRQQAAGATDDIFAGDPSGNAGVGRLTRTAEPRSGRVRSYDVDISDIPDDLRDDILPTGHQLSVDEANDTAKREMRQSQDIDGLRQDQILNRDR